MSNHSWPAYSRAGGAMFLVGSLAAVSGLVNDYPFYGGQAARYVVSAALLFAVAAARRIPLIRPTGRETLLLVALAATGLVLFNLFVIEGTRHANPAVVGTIVGTVPIVLALAGPLMRRTRPSGRIILAASIVVAGTVLVSGFGTSDPQGILYSVGALACEACFSLLALPLLVRLGPVRVSAYTAATSVPMLLGLGLLTDGSGFLRTPSLAELGGLAYLAVLVSGVAFLLWYRALPMLGADRAGLFAGIIPVGTITTSLVLGFGLPASGELAGVALVIVGLLVGLYRPRVTAPPAGRPKVDIL
ncbi:DMT family transporter [Kribbella sp. CA-293567]|uniref:DMT family transporter n=1 Tax=Kribbella sp. CA-293567 TaxID=3002436 RepID=UPI0022DD20A4|nr:DMT family transporter [Kribbella sp. CA-293567]WBQ03537.1 DMT family transporter [Kribbella sp. CA-293567]